MRKDEKNVKAVTSLKLQFYPRGVSELQILFLNQTH